MKAQQEEAQEPTPQVATGHIVRPYNNLPMPIFEYRCRECNHKFEKIVWKDSEEIACPNCGHREVEKLLSSFAVHAQAGGRTAAPDAGPCCACGAAEAGACPGMRQ
ncbi:MAG: hypothetical protein Kow00109_05170 [Acidobacteriota bacterium]